MVGDKAQSETGNTIHSVEKAFNIVERLETLKDVTVSELAADLDLPKSTAHVYLKTLAEAGYVVDDDGSYRLGLRFLKHGGHVRNRSRLYKAAKLEVDKLARETEEVANLGVEENGMRVLIYKTGGPNAIHDNAPIGEYTQMHWTALGKAILAHLPDERVETIIDAHGLPRANEHTITDREELAAELEQIRTRGYSVEDEDRREGVLTIAVPIKDTDRKEPVGAVSISGPKNRVNDRYSRDELVDMVRSAANVIELRYNHY